MLRIIGLAILTLGWFLYSTKDTKFGLVANEKELPPMKRFIFWLRGGVNFMTGLQNRDAQMADTIKGIPPKKHWRTEKTPTIIAIVLIVIGSVLSLY